MHNLLESKRVILIDDSMIAARRAAKLSACAMPALLKCIFASAARPPFRRAITGTTRQAKKSSSRPITPSKKFATYIEADWLAYLSLDGLLQCGRDENNVGYCTACYTDNYPTQWVDVEDIMPAAVALQRTSLTACCGAPLRHTASSAV